MFEVLEVNGEVRDLIGPHADSIALDAAAIKGGMTTMIDDAVAKCRDGVDLGRRGAARHDDPVRPCRPSAIAR